MSNSSELHWYGTQHTNCDPFRSLFHAAASEKEDLMGLNNRLADVFMKLEKMQADGGKGGGDVTAFLHAIQCLQEEIKKIKICYENQISKMRREIELIAAEKNELLTNFNDCKMCYETLQSKHDDVTKENTKLNDDIGVLKLYTAKKESELAELTNCMQTVKSELELMRPKACKYEQDSDNYRKQWECERRQRQEADDKNCQLVEKLNFETRMHEQQVRDLEDRLANATAMIECLNKRLHEQTNGSEMNNINEILQRMREQMLSEFVKYKKDTEDSVNKALSEMKDQLERSLREKQLLSDERDNLTSCVSRLQGQLSDMQGQLSSACQCNQQLQQSLQGEKSLAAKNMRELECKVLGLQDSIMLKVREVSAAREVQTALRSEIESYKILLEREEKRLSRTCLPSVNTATGTQNPFYAPQGGFPTGAPQPFAGGCGGSNNSNCSGTGVNVCGGGAPGCGTGTVTCGSLLDSRHFGTIKKTPETCKSLIRT